jgi:hypothetical protein
MRTKGVKTQMALHLEDVSHFSSPLAAEEKENAPPRCPRKKNVILAQARMTRGQEGRLGD